MGHESNGTCRGILQRKFDLTSICFLFSILCKNPLIKHHLPQILCSVDPKLLKLTPHDDAIYKAFRERFPDLRVDVIDENELKSEESKQQWRPFCEQFKDIVEDYSFGTLLRSDCSDEYSQDNSILTSRIQFYAIELARNREGFNDQIRQKFKPRKIEKATS